MTNSIALNKASVDDVYCTFNSDTTTPQEKLEGTWIYSVDPETFLDVKSHWINNMDGTTSIADAFRLFLKEGKKSNAF